MTFVKGHTYHPPNPEKRDEELDGKKLLSRKVLKTFKELAEKGDKDAAKFILDYSIKKQRLDDSNEVKFDADYHIKKLDEAIRAQQEIINETKLTCVMNKDD
jgi:hypothetical protein